MVCVFWFGLALSFVSLSLVYNGGLGCFCWAGVVIILFADAFALNWFAGRLGGFCVFCACLLCRFRVLFNAFLILFGYRLCKLGLSDFVCCLGLV